MNHNNGMTEGDVLAKDGVLAAFQGAFLAIFFGGLLASMIFLAALMTRPVIYPDALHIDNATAYALACSNDHLPTTPLFHEPTGSVFGQPSPQHLVVCGGKVFFFDFRVTHVLAAVQSAGSLDAYVTTLCDKLTDATPRHISKATYVDHDDDIHAKCVYGGTMAHSYVFAGQFGD